MIKIGSTLTPNDVETKSGTPKHLSVHAGDVCGPHAVAIGVKDALAGATVRFAACHRNEAGPPVVDAILTVRLDSLGKHKALRWIDTDGGSSSVIASDYPHALDPALLAAVVTHALARRSEWYYRIKGD